LFSVVVLSGLVFTAGCASSPAPVDTSTEEIEAPAEGAPAEASQDEVSWDSTTLTLPGEVDQDMAICASIDWSPALSMLQSVGVTEAGRTRETWSEVIPAYWPTSGYTPEGRILTGRCGLQLTSSGDPNFSVGGLSAQVWVIESSADARAFWESWDGNEQFASEVPAASVSAANIAALQAFRADLNPKVFAVSNNVMASVGPVQIIDSNAETTTPSDPTFEAQQAAYSEVVGGILTLVG
jgi:hypothetical protein